MEDGTPPPDSVVIERVCNGMPRPEGYTDSRGRFSFQLGQQTRMMADASVGANEAGFSRGGGTFDPMGSRNQGTPDAFGGISTRDLAGCELRASLPGFRSDVVMLSGRRMFDNPDVGTIVLRRLGNVEGTTVSMTSLQAPKEARKAYEKGAKALNNKKWPEAQKEIEKAVGLYPQYAIAWNDLGRALEQQNKLPEARDAYGKAVVADAKFVKPYLQLAGIAARENKWQEVAETTDQILKLNPVDFPGAYFYNALAYVNLKNLDSAEKSAREVVKMDTQHRFAKASHLLGIILAQKGDFAGATQYIKQFLSLGPSAGDTEVAKKQLAELERLAGANAQAPNPQP